MFTPATPDLLQDIVKGCQVIDKTLEKAEKHLKKEPNPKLAQLIAHLKDIKGKLKQQAAHYGFDIESEPMTFALEGLQVFPLIAVLAIGGTVVAGLATALGVQRLIPKIEIPPAFWYITGGAILVGLFGPKLIKAVKEK